MKSYPSMQKVSWFNPPGIDLYTFDKLDGSNLRFEYKRKSGWYKQRTRTQLFDANDPVFGGAIKIFQNQFAEPLAKLFYDLKWDPVVVFAEFYGERSFAGLHHPTEEKKLVLLDVSIPKQGIIDPRDYMNVVETSKVPAPNYLGVHRWNRPFLEMVRDSKLSGITFEGVVGKRKERHELILWKTKTMAWRDAIKNKFEEAIARKLIES